KCEIGRGYHIGLTGEKGDGCIAIDSVGCGKIGQSCRVENISWHHKICVVVAIHLYLKRGKLRRWKQITAAWKVHTVSVCVPAIHDRFSYRTDRHKIRGKVDGLIVFPLGTVLKRQCAPLVPGSEGIDEVIVHKAICWRSKAGRVIRVPCIR